MAYKILSLDGGGIRGLITAIGLRELESKVGKPLNKVFDLVAGTSTGGIIACGISKGIDVDEVVNLYLERGKDIFPSSLSRNWSRVSRLISDGVSAPKYDGKGLEKVLKDTFHTTVFGSLKVKPTLITTYDVFGREATVLKNTNTEHQSLRVWEIAKATSSAPTYFPAHMLEIEGVDLPLVDGGVVANNPTACAIAEAVRIQAHGNAAADLSNIVVASFGTGETTRPITPEQAKEWGATEWVIPLIDVLFDGSSDSVNYIARQLLADGNYFRYAGSAPMGLRLEDAYDDLDNADETNLRALERISTQYFKRNDVQKSLDSLVEKLK